MEKKIIVELTQNQIDALIFTIYSEMAEFSNKIRISEKVLSTLNNSDGYIFTETKDDVVYYKTKCDTLKSLLHILLYV